LNTSIILKNINSIAIGGFDGMHIGHQVLFKHLNKEGMILQIDTGYSNLTPNNKRETTHSFATLERGFINLGIVRENIEKDISTNFYKLVTDVAFRELLFLNIKRYSFRENKRKVVEMILGLLN